MARSSRTRIEDDVFEARSPRRRKRFKRRYILLFLLVCMVVGVAFGVPYAASNRSLVVSLANRYSGLAPNRIDLDRIQVSWFSPLKIEGLRLLDGRGGSFVHVGAVLTDKGLFGFALNSNDLGTILVKDAVVQIEVQPGTTNIEEAFRSILQASPSATASTKSTSPSTMTGTLKLENAVARLMDTVDLSAWELKVQSAEIPIPNAKQPIPMITANGIVQPLQANNQPIPPEMVGQFTLRLEPSTEAVQVNASPDAMQPIRLAANATQLPLPILSLAKRRMPEIPFEKIAGKASLQADLTMLSTSNWLANVTSARLDNLQILSQALLGSQPAAMQQVLASGRFSLSKDRILADKTQLNCDVGQLIGTASLPLPLPMPSATKPWIDQAEIDLQGTVDMARLTQIAPGLIKMQEQTQLVAGKATMSATQKMQSTGTPVGKYEIQLGDLVANVQGTTVKWEQAFGVGLEIQPGKQANSPQFVAKCNAEFCQLDATGGLSGGNLNAVVDLDKLQKRLSSWFVLPFSKLAGNAQCNAEWKQDANQRLQLNGSLVTSPLRIGLPAGLLAEPAWNGKFDVVSRLVNNSISQIERASVSFTSEDESLQVEVLEPISLLPSQGTMQPLPPASAIVKMTGDIASWQKRGQMFAGVDPGIGLGGRCSIEARGQVDLAHAEITAANWSAAPLTVRTNGMVLQEQQVKGEFAGRVDSQAIQRLQVDKLLVTSSSFGISAIDAPSPTGSGRQGKAAFRIDPKRLMAAMESSQATTGSSLFVEGDIQGAMNWTIDGSALTWQMETNGKDLRVVQTMLPTNRGPGNLVSTNSASTSLLWNEPIAKATMVGRYNLATGAIDLPESQLQTEWIAYAGQTTVASAGNQTKLVAKGQMSYDASRVAERLRPWIGNYLEIAGQRTEPVEVQWVSSASGNWADSLQAKTNIGWDSANVIGIEVGKASVPLSIENGHFKSKTEIPVSQGSLRWNLDGNVGSDPILISQAPEVVLDNVAITPMMCQGWLKYVAPLVAEVTKVQGKLSLKIDEARIVPTDMRKQKFVGQLQLHGATVGPGPLADQFLLVAQQVKALRKGNTAAAATANETWLQMPAQNIDFSVDSGRVVHKNVQFSAGDVVIQTSGEVAIDGSIQMMAAVPIRKEWIDSTPILSSLEGQSLQLPITGTLQKPQIDFRGISQLTMQAAQGAAQGYIQKQFDKGINKLLGPMQQQLQNFQQGLPLPQGILPGQGFQPPAGAAPAVPPTGP